MKLLDLINLHQESHEKAVLWVFRFGQRAGMTSMVHLPNCFAIEIKDPRLTVQILEQMIHEYKEMGCLKPQGPNKILNGEQFLPLMVDIDEYGMMSAYCDKPNLTHA